MKPRTPTSSTPPNWNLNSHGWGGKLADIPKPHIRKFPNPHVRREVVIKLSSWCTCASIGAKHVYVEIKEEENFLWDSAGNCWRAARDDEESKGRVFKTEFIYGKEPEAVKNWIDEMLKKHFPVKTHKRVYRDDTRTLPKNRLYRDGD